MASERRTFRRPLGLVVAGAFVAFASSPALAKPPAPSAADRETARSLLEQGRTLSEKGNQKDALVRFKAADDIMHVPSTAIRVARAQAALGQLVEARDTISSIQRMPLEPNEPAPFHEARVEAGQLDAALAPRIPSLILLGVTGAGKDETPTLTLDGAPLPPGVIGLPRVLDPGHHVLGGRTPTAAGTLEIDVKESEQKKVELALASTGATVVATTEPAGTTTDATVQTKRVHGPTPLTWAGVGLAGAGVVAGTVTGVLVLSKKSKLKTECPDEVCGVQGSSDLSSANTLATVSTISFIAAGVGATVAIVSLAVGHDVTTAAGEPATEPGTPNVPEAKVRVEPWFGGFAGGLRGTF